MVDLHQLQHKSELLMWLSSPSNERIQLDFSYISVTSQVKMCLMRPNKSNVSTLGVETREDYRKQTDICVIIYNEAIA